MLERVRRFLKQYDMLQPGDTVVCAVSGGADSMALLWCFYLLKDTLQIRLEAAHFNHGLRGEESDGDEAFVRAFCDGFHIPLTVGRGEVSPGKKGLEAAARDARYSFLESLPGKLATAHTADDNAETVLMHLVRGTGLKGLGGIAPVRGRIIRPMLDVTRQRVISFLEEYHISYVTDSSNEGDAYLRNRLRHHVMPLLKAENPSLAENLSAMAQRLREDEAALADEADFSDGLTLQEFAQLPTALQNRRLAAFLKNCGVREPDAKHIALAKSLANSDDPSARASLPGGVMIGRQYGRLVKLAQEAPLEEVALPLPGEVNYGAVLVQATATEEGQRVQPQGKVVVRCRQSGDSIRLAGGTKSLKKLFIDRKIPEAIRHKIAVVADDKGVLAVDGFGYNLSRLTEEGSGIKINFLKDR